MAKTKQKRDELTLLVINKGTQKEVGRFKFPDFKNFTLEYKAINSKLKSYYPVKDYEVHGFGYDENGYWEWDGPQDLSEFLKEEE